MKNFLVAVSFALIFASFVTSGSADDEAVENAKSEEKTDDEDTGRSAVSQYAAKDTANNQDKEDSKDTASGQDSSGSEDGASSKGTSNSQDTVNSEDTAKSQDKVDNVNGAHGEDVSGGQDTESKQDKVDSQVGSEKGTTDNGETVASGCAAGIFVPVFLVTIGSISSFGSRLLN